MHLNINQVLLLKVLFSQTRLDQSLKNVISRRQSYFILTPWHLLMWVIFRWFLEKSLSQNGHLKGFSFRWTPLMCLFSCPLPLKVLGQCRHFISFRLGAPVMVGMWTRWNELLWNCFSLSWELRWKRPSLYSVQMFKFILSRLIIRYLPLVLQYDHEPGNKSIIK